MRPWRAVVLGLAAVALPLACAQTKRAPALADRRAVQDAGAAGAGLDLGDAEAVPTGPCGAESIPAISNPPNLAFIIDHSASMGETLAGSGVSKYENARIALSHVLRAVGHRVNYSATIFPGLAGVTGCEPGDQLVKMQAGDPPSYASKGETGPRLKDLLDRLQIANVDGGTPAAATLTTSLATLRKLKGKTYVVLITDGAPNCNADLACAASACIPNIERLVSAGESCVAPLNCCAPSAQRPYANWSCVDEQASLDAVQALSDAGINTFVVGMPGSEPYQQLLDGMAELGGTAQAAKHKYFPVTDSAALQEALVAIAASVSISCDIPLDYEPPDPNYVNVYFDGALVEYDPLAGWDWTAEGHVAIHGAACDQLSTGNVLEVQVLTGCKTVVK